MTDVAIIGMSCRFPGAASIAEYRSMLREGRSAIRALRDDEIRAAGVPDSMLRESRYVKRAAPLSNVGEFDTELFGLRPDEAAYMDPQQYHLLECVYEALETACCQRHSDRLRVGVFVGADQSYYAMRRIPDDVLWDPMGNWGQIIANDNHFLATSIAYRLGHCGPAIEVQTACSTSLVAVHLAVQSLLGGDCDVAVAGGASIRGPQMRGYLYRDGSILSPTGSCRPFDKDADGTILSSGAGVVVLQRLDDAISGSYPIWAVVKGSAVNNDGGLRLAFTAPSEQGQTTVIREALSVSQVDPGTIGFVEAHGTATRLGDLVEYGALVKAFDIPRTAAGLCRLGSVKSNFGHLETAAGVAGLIKAILTVKYGELYPTLNFSQPNPEIALDTGPFAMSIRLESFARIGVPRRAGVSSFGIGGTNCHVVVEEPPQRLSGSHASVRKCHILGVSAFSPHVLRSHSRQVMEAVSCLPHEEVADGCFSLLACRTARLYRVAQVLVTDGDKRKRLPREPQDWDFLGTPEEQATEVIFALPSAWPDASAVFHQLLEGDTCQVAQACPSLFQRAASTQANSSTRRLAETVFASFEAAVWLLERGVRPARVLGPMAPQLTAMIEGDYDLAGALERCLKDPPTCHDRPIAMDCDGNRLVIELLRNEPLNSCDKRGDTVFAIDTESRDPIEVQLTKCLAELWVRGISVDWGAVFGSGRKRLALPTYPFDRNPVWRPPANIPRPPAKPLDEKPSREDQQSILARLWHGLLGFEPTPSDRFLDSGGNSLMAVQLAARISDELGTRISSSAILEARNFGALLRSIESSLADQTQKHYLLSPNQEAVWYMHKMDIASAAYNVQAAFKIAADLRPAVLRNAFDLLVARHEALRLTFSERDGQLRQRVTRPQPLSRWRYVDDLAGLTIDGLLVEHGRTPLELDDPPLLSVLLIKASHDDFVLSVVSHHIVSDEWSAQLMLGEVLELYQNCITGESPRLPLQPSAYGREAEAIRQRLVSADAYDRLAYWRTKLSDVATLDLPCDRARPAERKYCGAVLHFHLPPEEYACLRSLAHRHQATPFMVLVAAFNVLLHRYTGQDDICIGTNLAGRDTVGTADLVGLFTNTVPLRNMLDRNSPFTVLLSQLRNTVLAAQDNELPLPSLVEHLDPPRENGRNPFFDITLVLQNVPRHESCLGSLRVEPIPVHNGTCKFDLELCLSEATDGSLTGHWEYDCQLFDRSTIDGLSKSFHRILEEVSNDSDVCVSRISLLSEPERRILVHAAAATKVGFPDQSIWDVFQRQATSNPTAVAVLGSCDDQWTYQELMSRASKLGERLRSAGASPGVLIGLLCDRTEQYVVALLAVQTCGAAFVPLDTALPDILLAEMIANSQVHAVVLDDQNRRRLVNDLEPLAQKHLAWIAVDSSAGSLPAEQPNRLSQDLAYVIYTSGSTGRPKGAMVTQCGMRNHLWAKVHSIGLDATTVLAQTAPVCFDISIWQIIAPLLVGGTVAMVSNSEVMDVKALVSRVKRDGVTVLELVPSYLDLFIRAIEQSRLLISSLKLLIATGEQLPVETCRRWFEACPSIPLMNAYGPTECSDDVAQHVLTQPPPRDTVRIPIGHAIPNVSVHVLDDYLEPVPAGMPGEICITGVCVGMGYLRDKQRSAEAFVSDPFAGQPGAMLYRSGDIGIRRAGGELEYVGRRDHQVKVRGVRIEIEEVESVLRACKTVEQIAITQDLPADSLIAFVQLRSGIDNEVGLRELRRHAEQTLPGYMIPSRFTTVPEVPRSASGKIDRVTIRSLKSELSRLASVDAPLAEMEGGLATLHHIWSDVLNIESVPSDVDFFNLGGDSLKAMRVASLAQSKGLAVSTQDVVRGRTLAAVWALSNESVRI